MNTQSSLYRRDAYLEQFTHARSALFALLDMYGAADYYYTHANRRCCHEIPEYWITNAFMWSETPQGDQFWCDLHSAWLILCKSRREELIANNQINLL